MNREKLNEYICPILLAATECFASLYAFHKVSAFVLGAFFLLETGFLFRVFTKFYERKRGGLLYALIFTVVMALSFFILRLHAANYGVMPTLQWIYGQLDEVTFEPDLVAALAVGGSFFLISIVFYFTIIRFRPLGIMLCTMFPFFCFTMRSDDMPNILITLIVLLFLAVMIHNRRLNDSKGKENRARLQVDRAYVICIAVFVLITGAITMAIEKPDHEALFEKNANFLTRFNYGVGGSSDFESLSRQSSARNGRPDYNFNPLFSFETDSDGEIFFLRTQAFRRFNGDVWADEGTYDWSAYSRAQPEYATDDVVNDFASLTGEDLSGLYKVQTGRVYDDDFAPWYLPAPLGVITDDRAANDLVYYKLLRDTSVYRTRAFLYARSLDDSFSFIDRKAGLYQFARELGFSSEEYLEYLDSFEENPQAIRLKNDYSRVVAGYTDKANISDRLTELSEEIVADCHSDIEKAMALESYFEENGFKYSLEYVPEDNSVDYFVFESKTGYCAGYATAMTLMARAVGLPARYVEGFAAFEKQPDGSFLIRDGYAHAFVEVYIPGAGWLTFDPTVSDYRNNPFAGMQDGMGIFSRIFAVLSRISVVLIIGALVLVASQADRIKELFIRASLPFKPVNKRIITLYGNVIRAAGKSINADFSSYTPDMITAFLLENRGIAPKQLIDLFEKTAFGVYECSKEEYTEAYKEYKHCFKYVRKASNVYNSKL